MIPKIIHQTWKGPPDTLPANWVDSYKTWTSLAQEFGFQYMYWDDTAIDKFIQEHFPWFLEKFRAYPYGIQRADTFRYFALYQYGGIYSDFDNIPSRSFFSEWFPKHQQYHVVIGKCKIVFSIFVKKNFLGVDICFIVLQANSLLSIVLTDNGLSTKSLFFGFLPLFLGNTGISSCIGKSCIIDELIIVASIILNFLLII